MKILNKQIINKINFNYINKQFFSIKKLPNLRKYGEVKFNFKNFIMDLPLHISNIRNRKVEADAESVASLYKEYMSKLDDINLMRRQLNKIKHTSTDLKKGGKDITQFTKDAKKSNDDINKYQNELLEIEYKLMDEMLRIPNLTHPDTPVGNEEKAKVLKIVGQKRKLII